MKPPIEVVGAVIVDGVRILAAQRGPGKALAGFWEFPGGKVEPGETPAAALAREIEEELGCQIDVGQHVATTTHEYEFGTIRLATYYSTLKAGVPSASEHAELRWVELNNLKSLAWAPADIPAVMAITHDRLEN
ncbi:MAG: (deoxy)nucleoside triphosphate pyrophosphohydrolase [Microbacterium sp.]